MKKIDAGCVDENNRKDKKEFEQERKEVEDSSKIRKKIMKKK